MIATYTKSSRVMDRIQEVGRSTIDKTGLGFELNPSTTSQHHVGSLTLCDSEPLNLNAQLEAESEGEITNPSQRQDKGKSILYIDVDGTESRNPNRFNNHFDSRPKTRSKPQNRRRKNPSKGYGRIYPSEEDWDPTCKLNNWRPTQFTPSDKREPRPRSKPYHIHNDFQKKGLQAERFSETTLSEKKASEKLKTYWSTPSEMHWSISSTPTETNSVPN